MTKNIWQQFGILLKLFLFVWVSFADAASHPEVARVIVGGQPIMIPAPNSFSQATTPRMIRIGELATVKEDRLLVVFGTTSDVKEEAKGGIPPMERYGYVQATLNVEPYQIPLDRFAKYKADTKAETLAGLSAEDRVAVQKNIALLEQWVKSDMNVKLQVDVPRLGSVYVLDETPTSLTIVTKAATLVTVAGGKQHSVEQIAGISQMLVKSKVIWLQLYARSNSREDFDWVAKNIVKWTRAVSAANL